MTAISIEHAELVFDHARRIPNEQVDQYFKHVADLLRPIRDPDAGDVRLAIAQAKRLMERA